MNKEKLNKKGDEKDEKDEKNVRNKKNVKNVKVKTIKLNNKNKFSEVLTPPSMVQEICDKFDELDMISKYNICKIYIFYA